MANEPDARFPCQSFIQDSEVGLRSFSTREGRVHSTGSKMPEPEWNIIPMGGDIIIVP